MDALTRRRLAAFRANRRGTWSLVLFTVLFALSLGAEMLANDRPILVRYDGAYAATTIICMGDRSGFSWTPTPTNNYIDEWVHKKLQRVKVAPSELCTDEEFVRRVYLDLAGLPPTAATASSTWTTTGVDHGTNRLIYVRLASTPPAGVTITALLAAPATDIQGTTTTLTTSYQALETNIHPSVTPYAITYTVSATSAVAPQTQGITVYYCLVRQGSSTSSVPCP